MVAINTKKGMTLRSSLKAENESCIFVIHVFNVMCGTHRQECLKRQHSIWFNYLPALETSL